jgi:hypothetical protein
VWGDGYGDRVFFTGLDHPASSPRLILHYDLEASAFAAGEAGHLLLLGLRSIDYAPDPFRAPSSGVPVVEWARAQGPGVVTGMAHAQFWPEDGSFPSPPVECCMPWELPVHAARGRLHFLSTERRYAGEFRPGQPIDDVTLFLWSKLLGAGLRLPLAGASDYPCVTHVFEDRTLHTDVAVDAEPPTYGAWLDGLRAGRTTVADGTTDHLHLRVNGVGVGGEVQVAAGGRLTAWVESAFAEADEVQIRGNGQPLASVRVAAGAQATRVELPLAGSAWVIASSRHTMTSPVYVVVGGRPIGNAGDACYLVRYVDHLSDLVQRRRLDLRAETAPALAAYAEARAELMRRVAAAGGTTCE